MTQTGKLPVTLNLAHKLESVTVRSQPEWLEMTMTRASESPWLAVYIYVSNGNFQGVYITCIYPGLQCICFQFLEVYTRFILVIWTWNPAILPAADFHIYWYNNVIWFHATSFMLMYPNGSQPDSDLHIWMDQILVQAIKCRPDPSKTRWIVQMCWTIKCRMKRWHICQGIKYYHSNQMQLNINQRQVEVLTYGWNHSHAGWND